MADQQELVDRAVALESLAKEAASEGGGRFVSAGGAGGARRFRGEPGDADSRDRGDLAGRWGGGVEPHDRNRDDESRLIRAGLRGGGLHRSHRDSLRVDRGRRPGDDRGRRRSGDRPGLQVLDDERLGAARRIRTGSRLAYNKTGVALGSAPVWRSRAVTPWLRWPVPLRRCIEPQGRIRTVRARFSTDVSGTFWWWAST